MLPQPSLCPSHAIRQAGSRVARLTLPYHWHSPSLCQAFHTEMQVASCSRICAERTVLPASHWHHCFQRWFGWHEYIAQRELGMVRSRDRTQRPQGSLSKRQKERDRKRERERTGGAQRENPRIGEGAPAMVIIWTVTDTDSFPPGADQGQPGRTESEREMSGIIKMSVN